MASLLCVVQTQTQGMLKALTGQRKPESVMFEEILKEDKVPVAMVSLLFTFSIV